MTTTHAEFCLAAEFVNAYYWSQKTNHNEAHNENWDVLWCFFNTFMHFYVLGVILDFRFWKFYNMPSSFILATFQMTFPELDF